MKRARLIGMTVMLGAAVAAIAVAQTRRGPGPHRGGPPPCADPMPDGIQTKLLEEFGDAGIDADASGTLTCEEVKAFFDANPDLRPPRPPHHGPPPCVDPIPEDIQSMLLEDFGDEGIDADASGSLTCDEVEGFFEANPPPGPPPGHRAGPPPGGPRGMKGKVAPGPRGSGKAAGTPTEPQAAKPTGKTSPSRRK